MRSRYSPEVAPRSTLALLAFAAIFSIAVHLLVFPCYSGWVGFVGPGDGEGEIALQRVSLAADSLSDLKRFLSVVARNSFTLLGYLVITGALGALAGLAVAQCVTRRVRGFRSLAKHEWAYQHVKPGTSTFAHVLSSAGPDTAMLLYDGELVNIGLSESVPGQITYLCLKKVHKGVLRVDATGSSTIDIRQLDPVPDANSMFLIRGEAINNVVFSTIELEPKIVAGLLQPSQEEWQRIYDQAARHIFIAPKS